MALRIVTCQHSLKACLDASFQIVLACKITGTLCGQLPWLDSALANTIWHNTIWHNTLLLLPLIAQQKQMQLKNNVSVLLLLGPLHGISKWSEHAFPQEEAIVVLGSVGTVSDTLTPLANAMQG